MSLPFDTVIPPLLAAAKAEGLESVEVYARRDQALTVKAFAGTVENFQRSDSVGVGVRVFLGERVGHAYTENLAPEALTKALREAASNAELVEAEPGSALAAPDGEPVDGLVLHRPGLREVPLEAKMAAVLELERATREGDARVSSVPGCVWSDMESVVRVANTKGLDRHYRSNLGHAQVYPIVSDGVQKKVGHEMTLTRDFQDFHPTELAKKVLDVATKRLGAKEIASGAYPVVFTPKAFTELLSAFLDAFSAKYALEGKSLLAGKVGELVASPLVQLVDDPHLAEGFASRPFDDEGTPTKPFSLIEGGRFTGFLHSVATANRMKEAPTGHAARGGYKGTVGVSPSNLFLKPGTSPAAELLKGAAVVVIDDLQGLHAGTNGISGDFSLQSQGELYQDGVRQHPVHQFTVAGNFLQMLAGIEALGDDLRFYPHGAYIGSPSVRVGSLAIAGA